jgi:hypothetical protein
MTRTRWLRLLGDLFLWSSGVGLLLSCYFIASWNVSPFHEIKMESAQSQVDYYKSEILRFHVRYGSYPATLDDLVTAKDGREPLLDGGPERFFDPWGNRFQFEVIPGDEPIFDDVIVWTISPKGERIETPRSRNRRR